MNSACVSSGLFGSIFRSEYIGHNIYTGRRSNFHLKITPIHGPVHKSDLDFSYLRSRFSWLTQAYYKGLINSLSQKVSSASMIIGIVINVFSTNEEKSYFQIFDQSIVTFCIRGLCLGFSNTSHVDSLDRFIKAVVDRVEFDIHILKNKE